MAAPLKTAGDICVVSHSFNRPSASVSTATSVNPIVSNSIIISSPSPPAALLLLPPPSEKEHSCSSSSAIKTMNTVQNKALTTTPFNNKIESESDATSNSNFQNSLKKQISPQRRNIQSNATGSTAATVQQQQQVFVLHNNTSRISPSSGDVNARAVLTSCDVNTTTQNTVIQVMCELPVSIQPTTQLHSKGPSISESKKVSVGETQKTKANSCESIAMKTQLVPVLVTTSPTTCLKQVNQHESAVQVEDPQSQSVATNIIIPSIATSTSSTGQRVYQVVTKNSRVGRPRKADVEILKAQGESSTSELKCLVCKRVFPRIKSLEAHMRIHTGGGYNFLATRS